MSSSLPSLGQLAEELAEIGALSPEDVQLTSRLVEDLDLDSLAVAELMVWVATAFDVPKLDSQLETLRWEGMTVQDLLRIIENLRGH